MINFRLIRHLWLFLAVAEEKNFGRAAKRLGMTQPPLTEQIQILEQALKVKLFDRSRRGAALTPVGAAILPAVRKFADQLERLELAVEEAVAGHQGMVTIGAISSAMFDVLPEVIERFKQDHPQVTVSVREIDSVDAVPSLEAGDIDLAFARLDGDLGKGIEWRPLTEEQLMVALPVDHPLANHREIALASLASEPLVMFARKVSPLYFDNLIATCRANGFSPRVLHEVRSVASQIAFVSCGQGIALVPAAMEKLAPANVVIRPLAQQVSVVTTTYAWNAERANPLVQALVNQLSERIS
ncbi:MULTISPECIES: LysR family transcriptional regulator [Pseudomonas]|jgi:DNA-binding transcriptional LysR family regulator|uniref:LysR family transcriptional regulator n=1 Tax=Pseudomonas TaxID=286 RepID=UPI00209308E1|nr:MULTISPECIES: LysR family transcriptional regulator [Pseudomonas]USS53390.1 LysR family transcriptional regulator [Pseudomonas kermanshahensis]UVL69248.1 LysR family transcriptional regulator [Pseudomonas sp. B21-031]